MEMLHDFQMSIFLEDF